MPVSRTRRQPSKSVALAFLAFAFISTETQSGTVTYTYQNGQLTAVQSSSSGTPGSPGSSSDPDDPNGSGSGSGGGSTTPTANGQVQFVSATYSVSESASSITVTATRANGTTGAISAQYATTNITAIAGVDYIAKSGTLSWANGEATTKSFTVAITNDSIYEGAGAQTFKISLSGLTGGATLGSIPNTTISILPDNDAPPSFSLSADTYAVTEGTPNLSVTVMRTGLTDLTHSVTYSTSDGAAKAGVRYQSVGGTLSFAPGESTKTITIPIINDTAYRGNQTFNVAISNPTYAATLSSPSSATVTVVEDEPFPIAAIMSIILDDN